LFFWFFYTLENKNQLEIEVQYICIFFILISSDSVGYFIWIMILIVLWSLVITICMYGLCLTWVTIYSSIDLFPTWYLTDDFVFISFEWAVEIELSKLDRIFVCRGLLLSHDNWLARFNTDLTRQAWEYKIISVIDLCQTRVCSLININRFVLLEAYWGVWLK
jgi:hypothetical protein